MGHVCTIIIRRDGIDRHYPCASYFDAVELLHLICSGIKQENYGTVELWRGDKLETKSTWGTV
jgi:hypothetical protein